MKLLNVVVMTEKLEPNILYYSEKYRTCIHLCACGCGFKTVTPLHGDGWILNENGGKPTLSPSIGNFCLPCKSHYFIENGEVKWC